MIIPELKNFLQDHEDDIANDVKDFGNLKPVFKFVFDREPQPKPEEPIEDPYADMKTTVTENITLDVQNGSFSAADIFNRPGKKVI